VQRLHDRATALRAEQHLHVGRGQTAQRDAAYRRPGAGVGDRRAEPHRGLALPVRQDEQDRRLRRAAYQLGEQPDARLVRQVHVVQHQSQAGTRRIGDGQLLHEAAHGAAHGEHVGRRGIPRRPGRLDAQQVLQPAAGPVQRVAAVVQRVQQRRERLVPFGLGRLPGQHAQSALPGQPGEFGQQPRLADARFPGDLQQPELSGHHVGYGRSEHVQFVAPPDKACR
jgi:hypothetical protein